MARTIVPLADLRLQPQHLPQNLDHNEGRKSQLLYNERVKVLETVDSWVHVAALEQLHFTPEKGWHPYEGWMHISEIERGNVSFQFVINALSEKYSYGTYLETSLPGSRPILQTFNRNLLVQEAKQFLDTPYLWGGRSSQSVDCSGLIDLLYRGQGVLVPRNAHDQFLFGKRTSQLLPGDPLYLAKDERINHVILKLEGPFFIEAPESGKRVRLLREGVDVWEKGGRWYFRDRPSSYRPFPTCFSIPV